MRHVVLLPDLGQTTSEAKVLKWWKRPGEKVLRGEPLLAVETDKVDMDVEAFVDGYLREILVESGTLATALKPVAILTDSPDEPFTEPWDAAGAGPRRIPATPAAKALARELGVALGAVSATGPQGLIVRKDVEGASPFPSRDDRAISAMAATVAASKRDIPHFYVIRDVEIPKAEAWRAEWNAAHADLRASLNDLFVRCAAGALRDVPRLNVRLEDGRYLPGTTFDLLMVVAQDSGPTLVTIPDPQASSWEQFLRFMQTVAAPRSTAARSTSRPLLALSNLGMFGVREFAAIIPPGCTAVLAIGTVRDAPVVREGRIEATRICTLTLSADHRVVDGITAARFLESMQHHLNSL